jgi:4-amino-4-deoxy-L-arabinose transferase-like glycosyltransferase
MLAWMFYTTDAPARLPAAVLNCFIGALTVVMAYRIARSLFSEWVAVKVAWWTCLLPSMIIWSSQTLKEPTVIFLETIVLYGCVRLKVKGFSLRHILACALAIVLVLPFRFYAAYIAGAAVALALMMPQFGKKKLSVGSAIGVAACILPIVMMSSALVSSEAQIERFDLKRIQKFREDIAVGAGSGVTSSYDFNSPTGLAAATIVGGSYLMLAPFPWQLGGGSVRMALTTPELVVWWWLFFVGVLPGMWHAIRTRFNEIQPLLFFLIGLGVLYSLMFGNVGLAYRQRAQLLPWLLIFAMVGLEERMRRRSAGRQARNIAQHRPTNLAIIDQNSTVPIGMPQIRGSFPDGPRQQLADQAQ